MSASIGTCACGASYTVHMEIESKDGKEWMIYAGKCVDCGRSYRWSPNPKYYPDEGGKPYTFRLYYPNGAVYTYSRWENDGLVETQTLHYYSNVEDCELDAKGELRRHPDLASYAIYRGKDILKSGRCDA